MPGEPGQIKNFLTFEAPAVTPESASKSIQESSWIDLLADSRALLISQELKTLYHVIITQLSRLIPQANPVIFIREDSSLRIMAEVNRVAQEQHALVSATKIQVPFVAKIFMQQEPEIVGNIWTDERLLPFIESIPNDLFLALFEKARSWLGVPILINQQAVGLLNLVHPSPDYFTERHARLAKMVVANAVNALTRLSKRTETMAVQEERQRIARELHDSVMQVFYGIELNINIARTLLKRQEIAPAEEILADVLNLAEAGLTEMRALLVELRPETLESEGLVAALKKHIATLQLRHGLKVEARLGQEPQIGLAAKEALYRIGQEAMQNIIKHARANLVKIQLNHIDGYLALVVEDNGRGFDPRLSFPGHLGLISMHERVAKLGGSIEIKSQPGQGTIVSAWLPLGIQD
jgi:signal transduction histidine kinase